MAGFDPQTYWETRLGKDWSLQGVGFRTLGRRFNEWAYRLRAERFREVVARHLPTVGDVLDVGSGTGFYIDLWQQMGARSVTGVDLTEAAVTNLRQRFPGVTFHRGDIGVGVPELTAGGFDAVSTMDVLFHIVDDARFERAIGNLHDALVPGGILIFSDGFLHGPTVKRRHIVLRSLSEIEKVLEHSGFEVVDRTPMFVTMNEPFDARRRLTKLCWFAGLGLVATAEPLGALAGRVLYRLDSRLVHRRRESPTTEIMVCRRLR